MTKAKRRRLATIHVLADTRRLEERPPRIISAYEKELRELEVEEVK